MLSRASRCDDRAAVRGDESACSCRRSRPKSTAPRPQGRGVLHFSRPSRRFAGRDIRRRRAATVPAGGPSDEGAALDGRRFASWHRSAVRCPFGRTIRRREPPGTTNEGSGSSVGPPRGTAPRRHGAVRTLASPAPDRPATPCRSPGDGYSTSWILPLAKPLSTWVKRAWLSAWVKWISAATIWTLAAPLAIRFTTASQSPDAPVAVWAA